MQFTIGGLQKTSLLDFPNKVSAIVFTQGCNFNCGYCHNPLLLKNQSKNDITVDVIFDFLNKRKGKLDGIVITGGEPTLQPDLKLFIQKIKEMSFLVKLDTNGTNPDIVSELLKEHLVDYIAMDIKAPLEKYSVVVNRNIKTEDIKKSVNLLLNSDIEYEFRTTVLPSLISIEDFNDIGTLIKDAQKYYLQKFEVQSEINDSTLVNEKNYTDEQFSQIIQIMKKYVKYAELR